MTDRVDWFGWDGPYNVYTGKDASRAWAVGSVDVKDCHADLADLTSEELEVLDRWWNYMRCVIKVYPK